MYACSTLPLFELHVSKLSKSSHTQSSSCTTRSQEHKHRKHDHTAGFQPYLYHSMQLAPTPSHHGAPNFQHPNTHLTPRSRRSHFHQSFKENLRIAWWHVASPISCQAVAFLQAAGDIGIVALAGRGKLGVTHATACWFVAKGRFGSSSCVHVLGYLLCWDGFAPCSMQDYCGKLGIGFFGALR